jgi:hypothetical protein
MRDKGMPNLELCKQCVNSASSLQRGIYCNLTGEKPTFEKECADFKAKPEVNGQNKKIKKRDVDGGAGKVAAILVGLAMAILGIILTAASYNNAYDGGSYTIWWGLILVGAITFIKGLIK